MSEQRNKPGSSLTAGQSTVPTSVALGPQASMDLAWLPEEERKALLAEHARGILDIGRKAQELHVDIGALRGALETAAQTTKQVSESGDAITVTHTQTTSIGRTEFKMGNTDDARTGRLSKSQTGERDWTPFYIIGGIIALVLIAAVLGR